MKFYKLVLFIIPFIVTGLGLLFLYSDIKANEPNPIIVDHTVKSIYEKMDSFGLFVLNASSFTVEEKSCIYKLHKQAESSVKVLESKLRYHQNKMYFNKSAQELADRDILIMKLKILDKISELYYNAKKCKDIKIILPPQDHSVPVSAIGVLYGE